MNRRLVYIAIAAVIAGVTLFSKLKSDTSPFRDIKPYWMTTEEEQFGPIKDQLPKVKVGFLSDRNDVGRYYRFQYYLAPHIIVNSPKFDVVLGDFENKNNLNLIQKNGLTIEKDLGNGMLILRRDGSLQ